MVLMTISAIFCWVIWVSVLYLIDPTQAGFLGFTFFYLSLFLSIVGTMSVLGLILRMKLGKEELVFKTVTTSFRQATLLGLLVIGGLILKSQRILTWWNILFLLLALIVIEFFFISYAKKR